MIYKFRKIKLENIFRRTIGKVINGIIGKERLYNFIFSNEITYKLSSLLYILKPGADFNNRKISADLKKIYKNTDNIDLNEAQDRILFIDPRGGYYVRIILGVIATRLKLHKVHSYFINCEDLPVCNGWTILNPRPKNHCGQCLYHSNQLLNAFKLTSKSLNQINESTIRNKAQEIVSNLTRHEIENYIYNELPLGSYIKVSASSYFLSGEIPNDMKSVEILRGFLAGLIILYHAYEKTFYEYKPDKIVIVNGRFFMHKLAYEMAKIRGIQIITLDDFGSTGGTGRRWMFSHNIAIAELDLSEYWQHWKNVQLTSAEKSYLITSFINGSVNNTVYYKNPQLNWENICNELSIDPDADFDVMFTNLTWDSTAIDKDICFNGMLDWIFTTIEQYCENKKLLLIRIHPAEKEIFGVPSLQKVSTEILNKYNELPKNIKIIPYDSNISSYQLLNKSVLKMVYSSTLGLEAAVRGLPVVVAADVHYRSKGFTIDVDTKDEYINIINSTRQFGKLSENQIDIALRYAFFYLYRTKIPLEFYKAKMFKLNKLTIKSFDELLPGKNPYLDIVIEGILNNNPIVLTRELTNELYKLK